MATIRRRERKKGTVWQVQVRLAGHEHVSKTFESREEAVSWARRMEGQIESRRDKPRSERDLGEAIGRYLDTVEPHKAESTRHSRKHRFEWWYKHHGTKLLSELTPDVIAEARDHLDQRGLSPATVNRYLTALSAVMRYAAEDWGWIDANPVSKVRRLPEGQGRVRYLEQGEIKTLLEECRKEGHELHLLVLMALATGMRRGELLSITWDQVDLQRRLIVLPDTKTGERRGIPISGALLEAIRDYPRRLDSDLLFPSCETWWALRQPWEEALARAKIEDFRFHDLRHTTASHLAMNGATPHEIADVLGHKTLAMVRRYSHLSPDHVAGVVESLSDTILPTPPRTEAAPDDEG